MRQSIFSDNCTVNVNAVPQMENKIHWRKITSSTSTKGKNDGQKAGTWERLMLAVHSPMIIAPPHPQNAPLLQVFRNICFSHSGDNSPRSILEKSLSSDVMVERTMLGDCLRPGMGLLCCGGLVAAGLISALSWFCSSSDWLRT